jgi:hypothetical protein
MAYLLLTTAFLKAEINFDIYAFEGGLKAYRATKDGKFKSKCFSMLNGISNDVPSSLKSTYESIKNLMRNAFDAADILYIQKPDTRLVSKSIDALVKEQTSVKRSFFGKKLIQGAKNLFAKKDKKQEEYNDMKKLFNDIFDALSAMIKSLNEDGKKVKAVFINKALDEINPF